MSGPFSADNALGPYELTWLNDGAGKMVAWTRCGLTSQKRVARCSRAQVAWWQRWVIRHASPRRSKNSSSQAQVPSTDPQWANSRRKVGVVLLEVTNDEWDNMYDWVLFLQTAGPELATATQTFNTGHSPRSNLLVKLLSQGALN